MRMFCIALFTGALGIHAVECFQTPGTSTRTTISSTVKKTTNLFPLAAAANENDMSIDELKVQLSAYLKKRDESNANESAKRLVHFSV